MPIRDAVPSPAELTVRDQAEGAAVGAGAHVCWVGGLSQAAQAADAVAEVATPGDVLTMGVGEVAGLGRCCWRPRTGP